MVGGKLIATLTAHGVLVAPLALKTLVDPHKFFGVKGADRVGVLRGRIGARLPLEQLGRRLAVVPETHARLQKVFFAL